MSTQTLAGGGNIAGYHKYMPESITEQNKLMTRDFFWGLSQSERKIVQIRDILTGKER